MARSVAQMDEVMARVSVRLARQHPARRRESRRSADQAADGKFVIDHEASISSRSRRITTRLPPLRPLDTGRRVSSAPYETSKTGARSRGRRALRQGSPRAERMMWASNWPHPSVPKDAPDDGSHRPAARMYPDDATRRMILVDNPAAFYGFGA
jgi:D-galactarolactone isomerase